MKHALLPNLKQAMCLTALLLAVLILKAQEQPIVTAWMHNTTELGTYYLQGNSTAISNNTLVNCQKVEYSATSVYVTATGVPAYPTGPFLDRNPSVATDQEAIYQFPLDPKQNTGTPTSTTGGNIGVFVNGVSLFDYRDGVAWDPTTNALCGGPGRDACPGGPRAEQAWNRDAIPAEMAGFDCSKGHPAGGNYHHHQNPSAFNLDLEVLSTVCNLYAADGLYTIDSTQHAPLIGFAYDGFPIYGAYGYKNADGSGGIARIKSGYALRNITKRTHHADNTDVDDGPDVDATYFLGYFREDYEWLAHTGDDYLDEHNGRFCVTPEYPEGTYAYFCTVDADWNSAYPYAVGPTFYGVYSAAKVTRISEETTIYKPVTVDVAEQAFEELSISIFPNPASDLIAIQIGGLVKEDLEVTLTDLSGKTLQKATIIKGCTIAYFDVRTLYNGTYLVRVQSGSQSTTQKVSLLRE